MLPGAQPLESIAFAIDSFMQIRVKNTMYSLLPFKLKVSSPNCEVDIEV
jgi:hypothetical protein